MRGIRFGPACCVGFVRCGGTLPKAAKVPVSSVTISSIGVRATKLETLKTDDDGVLEAPKNPDRAGW